MRQFQLSPDDLDTENEEAALILQGLNPAQQEAVQALDGPVLIIAGPGSGKTRVLTHRIAYLLATGKARSYQILALTFTNKAAREMKERVHKLVGAEAARGMWMGTFHSMFARLLRIEGDHLGFTSDFSIYDTDDTERLLRSLMVRHHIDPKQFRARSLRGLISSAKNQMVSPEAYARVAATLAQEKAALIYGPYQQALRRANAIDFDDLLLHPIKLFEQEPEILKKYQQRWTHLHVDEYQDTNRAQYILTKMLAAQHKNICVVGDDAQSIYAFRGADIGNILSFQRDYPKAAVVRLEQNYRSTKNILRLADSIIKHNKDQLEKELWTDNHEGDHVVLMEALSEKDEAQKAERAIRDLHLRVGYPYRNFAILYRTNAQSRSLEEALRRGGIPYRVIAGMSFYQRKEIKDALAYLRLLRILDRRGQRKPPTQTPNEFAASVAGPAAPLVCDFTRLYLKMRFGRLPHLLPRMNALLGEIRSQTWSKSETA
ncbi:MAG: UvrD-helicase domain-containing protein [Bacteroidetes bacterium]|nr:UvrD-helicase domain-containing protein [Bacteroidota bacterium]